MKRKKKGHGTLRRGVSTSSTTAHGPRLRNTLMAILTGGLLTAAWPTWGIAPAVFIAFVPLLLIEGRIAQGEKGKVFWLSFLAFLVWNVATTWWVWNATPAATLAWILNALFMAIVFWMFHLTKKRVCNNPWGNFFLIPYWMAFELLTYWWAAKWPWLNLGHVFSSQVSWIQWYEYTGVAGGTLWVLLVNILITNIIQFFKAREAKSIVASIVLEAMILLVPIIISTRVYKHYEDKGEDTEVIVVQQNCDPWNEQFNNQFYDQVIQNNIDLSRPLVTSGKTRFIVSSESAIQEGIWLHETNNSKALNTLRDYVTQFPELAFVIGGTTMEWVPKGMEDDFPARQLGSSDRYYYCHNSALLIGGDDLQHRNKSQLAPAVEAIPEWMGFLRNFSLTMGIARGTLKGDPEARVMTYGGHKIGAAICYESAFGEYVGSFCAKGADLIFVLTNDGWWGDTPGYKQHFEFSKLRAIENRRCIARSANTGRSGFFNQRGDVLQQTKYWEAAAIKATLKANKEVTFYAKNGDYLSRIAVYITFVLLITWIAKTFLDLGKSRKAAKTSGTRKKK
ncbi:MAG: apolipoprotein N-acyltransferase [Bacteroidales bacterium]|nr:apolipoprotein N-acyltransferase [Bacteroidales bacterium]